MPVTKVTRLDWDAAVHLLNSATNIALVTHVRPDGDAIGSLVGLGGALKERGRTVHLLVDGGKPTSFGFIPGVDAITGALPDAPLDLVIALDGSDLQILGEAGAAAFALGVPTLVIDHHATNDLFGSVHVVSSDYVSTTHVIQHLLKRLGWEISQPVAKALMLGIVTDTQCFRVGSITIDTFSDVQQLMARGVDLRSIVERTVMSIPHGQLQVIGRVIARATLKNHVIWSSLGLKEIEELGRESVRNAHMSDQLLQDEEAYISAFFQETDEGSVRVSMRAVPGFNVGALADSLGGGGHALAGGATIHGMSLNEAVALVVGRLMEIVERGAPTYADL
jgi:phosphoesterase RecJ-like protein